MLQFKNGDKSCEFDKNEIILHDVIKSLGLDNKKIIAAKFNGELMDLSRCVNSGGEVEAVSADSPEGLEILRHSTAHLMAQAILRLYPGSHFGVGPAIKDGFYYDVDAAGTITENDLPKIEAEMRKIAGAGEKVSREDMPKDEALKFFAEDPYKTELISEIDAPTVSVYKQGEYADLCRGPHVPDASKIHNFKLLSIAGAYWRGSEKNKMLTRIYGTAFANPDELKAYIKMLEEAKLRDHRKLGKDLDLFSLHEEGPGFPFFHPKGMAVMNTLIDFWRREHNKRGYTEIKTPQILDRELWIRSGHWDHYRENMYFTEIDEKPYAIKPMNCPGSILVYKTQLRSYRDLPMRLTELGCVHRHERSGVLHGLMRVRCFTQDDAHTYIEPTKIKEEVTAIMELDKYFYTNVFGFKYSVELSTRPEDSMGTDEQWEAAENALKDALESTNTPYTINPGDGAFYGPKIDFHLEDCIGRTWQCGTIQLDFQMPGRFGVTYIGEDGAEHTPVMIHRVVFGSVERFMGILIEHYAGAFPYWLAPVQVKIIPIADNHVDYAKKLQETFFNWGLRVEVDTRSEKLGKKIRDAQLQKVPYMLVVGDKEQAENKVGVRERSKGDLGSMTLDEFKNVLDNEFNPLKSR
ncbi:MAG: threonine--tRNA ligase [Synergistales bacterium]|nr:threonine--tRNA ligase [Synergistales bacterium]MDY6401646.1 threonine--tRNA ligase [Synergistales bacterium]MDY6405421.1 threonine--tRNA ligase [Synergistales bacterium]MDY6411359.1 threonine--tRNA ligase [Synergistales bacterium]MDY6414695.1 threonine--tRNA ligase [Synergistales bacterium]